MQKQNKNTHSKAFERHWSTAKKISKKNGGKLPSNQWLEDNGYHSLCMYMYRHKDLFSRFVKEKEVSTPRHRKTIDKNLKLKDSLRLREALLWVNMNGGFPRSDPRNTDRVAHRHYTFLAQLRKAKKAGKAARYRFESIQEYPKYKNWHDEFSDIASDMGYPFLFTKNWPYKIGRYD